MLFRSYYQYTGKAATQFRKLEHRAFWLVAHWLGRKFQLTTAAVLARFGKGGAFTAEGVRLVRHSAYPTLRYKENYLKPNPYTTQAKIGREELPDENPWLGFEDRPGWADIRVKVLERDGWTCRLCRRPVTNETAQVDHLRRYSSYKRPVDANRPENLWTLCIDCHAKKTEWERQRESRMR